MGLTAIQRLVFRLVPAGWHDSIERESDQWMVRCPCGFEESVWDRGGIRWKAAGPRRRLLKCCYCRRFRWHMIFRVPEYEGDRVPADHTPVG